MCNRQSLRILVFSILYLFSLRVCAYRVFDTDNGVTILALENEYINIQCQTNMPMSYCGFIHPSGRRYAFSGGGLSNGHCAVKIKATSLDSGIWRCHIGRKMTGVESMQSIQVRVVNQLAAIETNITGLHGSPVTLECATTRGLVPLSYCRFEPPNGAAPFSINAAITAKNPILGRYYYPQNRSIDRGDCAVTIRKVKYEDVGLWTCGAGFDDGKEHIDRILLQVEGLYTMSTASVTGITFGAIGIAAFLCILGIVVWKKRRFLGTSAQGEPEVIEIQELGQRPRSRSPRVSPEMMRAVPSVVVQSPSEPSGTPK